jgi:2-pyrone-4,6-dicarboxylate lactonase
LSGPQASFHPSPSKPGIRLPALSCDSHVHVFGPRGTFPFAGNAPFIPPVDAPKERLFAMHAHIGVERCVIVQSGCHGFDNGVVEDALRARPGRYLGVALAPASVDDVELRRLAGAGFRGIRFNFMGHLGRSANINDVISLSRRLAAHGLHLQMHFESALIHELGPALKQSAVPVVIDHMGRVDAALGLGQADFSALLGLMEDTRFWVKVSGAERSSRQGPPYADAVPFAARLVKDYGDRVLWGTDWPHPNLKHVPDDGVLADLLLQIAPSEAQRQALLVNNPARLYRF